MKLTRSGSSKWVVAALVAVVTAAVGNVARAGDVRFSVGAHIAPGVTFGVSNAPPVYYAPPVYVAAPPVYYAPAPVYYAPVVYARPAYYGTTVVYRSPHRHGGRRHYHR